MNQHPMRYIGMIDRLLEQKGIAPIDRDRLGRARKRILDGAVEQAAAYGEFKDILKELAPHFTLADDFNKQTYLDLT